MSIKLLSCTPEGRIRRTNAVRQSNQSRLQQLLRELGIDKKEFERQSNLRMYMRMTDNKYLCPQF